MSHAAPPASTKDPRARVRAATRAIHDALEELPISRAIVDEEISAPTYRRLLASLLPLHRAIEAALAADPELADFAAEARRVEYLEADLATLGAAPPAAAAAEVGARIAALVGRGRPELLAAAYVVIGSRMGGLVLQHHLGRALGLRPGPGGGLRFHLEGAEGFPRRWRALCERLGALIAGRAAGERFEAAAVATMEAFYALYQNLGHEELGEAA